MKVVTVRKQNGIHTFDDEGGGVVVRVDHGCLIIENNLGEVISAYSAGQWIEVEGDEE